MDPVSVALPLFNKFFTALLKNFEYSPLQLWFNLKWRQSYIPFERRYLKKTFELQHFKCQKKGKGIKKLILLDKLPIGWANLTNKT